MTRDAIRNVPASVLARLLTLAKKTRDDYQTLLIAYASERFLFRLGASAVRDRFVLKWAMLLRLWSEHPYRATRDLDLLRRGEGAADAIRRDIEAICATVVEDDGQAFDTASMRLDPIRAEDEYAGTRVTMDVRCGEARINMQIDIAVGDTVYPAPAIARYSTLLGMSEPHVLAYTRESVIAEKLEAMVVLGERNSRIKDFFDVWYLARNLTFDRGTLIKAIASTFSRRATPMPVDAPIALTPAYWENPLRTPQIRAFARRARIDASGAIADDILGVIRPFLLPLINDVRSGRTTQGTWPPGGPWE